MENREGYFRHTAQSAGLMKGTTVVDNDLIETAFLVGAGVAGGYLMNRWDISEKEGALALVEVMAILQHCLEAAEQLP